MHRFVLGRSFAVLVAPILLSMLVFNHLKKKKKSAEKESIEGASSPSSFHPIPTGGGSDQYDVFLSFNGSNIQEELPGRLYDRLVEEGLRVLWGHNSIPIGEESSSLLLDAITRSKISIPIISKNYASSKWCLRELIQIIDCKKSKSHIVLPIFHKVDRMDVRHLKGSFGEAFQDHSRMKRLDEKDIQEGRQALKEVSHLDGWESEKVDNGHEGDLVKLVVETIRSELPADFPLLVPKVLVGLDGHTKKIMNWIDNPSDNARMIGIYGMGGIGKTTLAKCIFNQLSSKFKHVSFLIDIGVNAWYNNIKGLQSELISNILQSKISVSTIDEGIYMIKSKFIGKKVLILLDDVVDENQLNALAGERNWFALGSIIIVTTINEVVLNQSKFGVDYKHEMSGLDEEQSLILFNRHAFGKDHSSRDFADISRDIISNMDGHPSALETVGLVLSKGTLREWNLMLQALKGQLCVEWTWKRSYDALEEGHKEIFLDFACFFIGKKSKFATSMWDNRGFYTSQGIKELKLRYLIKIGEDGKLRMHHQQRNFGMNIICLRQSSETYSRLWVDEEAFRVLTEEKVTAMIEAFGPAEYDDHPFLDYEPADHLRTYVNEQCKKLPRLRFLRLRNATSSADFDKLFSEVRWLRWPCIEYNLLFSTTDLHLPKLVVLQLSNSSITGDWKGWSSITTAKQLKLLQLEYFESLECTPDLSAFLELEILILRGCRGLKQVHPSIAKLQELKALILDSSSITEIPTSIGSLRKLEKLIARHCRLREIPSSIGELQNLEYLDISDSCIERLPSAVGKLKKLRRLSLNSCYRLKGKIPREIGYLSSLEILEITSAPIDELPETIQNISSLQRLSLWDCRNLRSLPELPSGLKYLRASCNGPKLPKISHLIHLEELVLLWKRST